MKKDFLTGLIILLPVAITIAVVGFLVNFFTNPFVEIVAASLRKLDLTLLSNDAAVRYLSKFLILICLFIFIIFLGMITRWVVIRSILGFWDKLLNKIPVVKTVYKTTQELIKTILSSDKTAFKQVVLVPFPCKGTYALGLIIGDAPQTAGSLVSVLIPTTPNPTTGFILMYKLEDLKIIDMKPEVAIKYIVSCGVLTPEEKGVLA